MRTHVREGVPGTLRVSAGARAVVRRRCHDACERCGLEWPWLLYLFRVDERAPPTAFNLVCLCGRCSRDHGGAFTPVIPRRSVRDKLRDANNRRTGAEKLTEARRRRLIAARGGRCEACGIPGTERQLHVHHRLGVFRGGDDADQNLMVLRFACHHHLVPCAAGCGRWTKRPGVLCRRCETQRRLEEWSRCPSSSGPGPPPDG